MCLDVADDVDDDDNDDDVLVKVKNIPFHPSVRQLACLVCSFNEEMMDKRAVEGISGCDKWRGFCAPITTESRKKYIVSTHGSRGRQ